MLVVSLVYVVCFAMIFPKRKHGQGSLFSSAFKNNPGRCNLRKSVFLSFRHDINFEKSGKIYLKSKTGTKFFEMKKTMRACLLICIGYGIDLIGAKSVM